MEKQQPCNIFCNRLASWRTKWNIFFQTKLRGKGPGATHPRDRTPELEEHAHAPMQYFLLQLQLAWLKFLTTTYAYKWAWISLSPWPQTTKFLSWVISMVTSFKKRKTMGELAQKGTICYLHAKISKWTKAERIFSSEEQHQVQLQNSAEIHSNIHLTLRLLPSYILLDSGTGLLQTFLSSAKTTFPWPGITNTRHDKLRKKLAFARRWNCEGLKGWNVAHVRAIVLKFLETNCYDNFSSPYCINNVQIHSACNNLYT